MFTPRSGFTETGSNACATKERVQGTGYRVQGRKKREVFVMIDISSGRHPSHTAFSREHRGDSAQKRRPCSGKYCPRRSPQRSLFFRAAAPTMEVADDRWRERQATEQFCYPLPKEKGGSIVRWTDRPPCKPRLSLSDLEAFSLWPLACCEAASSRAPSCPASW